MIRKRDFDNPNYVLGKFYSLVGGNLVSTITVPAVDKIYFFPFRIFFPVLVKTIYARVATGGASSAMKSAVYANSQVSNRPLGAPLIVDNTGQATTGSNTNTSADVTDTLLGPGWYWGGTKFRATLPIMVSVTSNDPTYSRIMASSTGVLPNMGISFDDAYANSMPTITEGATFAEITGGGIPVFGIGT